MEEQSIYWGFGLMVIENETIQLNYENEGDPSSTQWLICWNCCQVYDNDVLWIDMLVLKLRTLIIHFDELWVFCIILLL